MAGETPGPSNSPVPIERLSSIATEACDTALEKANRYEHEKVGEWSSQIINKILQALIDATTTGTTTTPAGSSSTSTSAPPTKPSDPSSSQYRFNVSCTIIQQGHGSASEGGDAEKPDSSTDPVVNGRRGMYSASGAYWDVQRDGMWTFKYPRAEEKGMDIVLNVVWFGNR